MKTKFIAAVSFVALVASVVAQEPVTLRYNPTAGRMYRYTAQLGLDSGGGPATVSMKILMVLGLRVNAVTDTSIKLLQTVEYFRAESKQSVPGQDAMFAQAKKMRIEAEVDRCGKALSQKVAGAPSMGSMSEILNGFGASSIGIELPKDPVTVGSTWQQAVDISKMMGGAAQQVKFKAEKPLTVAYVLKSFGEQSGRKVAFVEWTIQGALTMDMSALGAAQGASAAETRLNFGGGGKAAVDLATGMSLTAETGVTIGINVTGMPSGTGAPTEMTQKLAMKSTLVEPNKL